MCRNKPSTHLNGLFLFLSILCTTLEGLGQTYYFSNKGSDNNKGTSPSSPFQSIAKALTLVNKPGTTILFKRGDEWYLPMQSFNLDNKTGITLGAYGNNTDPKPILAGMEKLADDQWEYQQKGIWKYKTINPQVHRLFVNGVSRINLRDKMHNANQLAALDEPDEYYSDVRGSSIYLFTGSKDNRPKQAVMIPGNFVTYRGFSTISMDNSTSITIKNLDIRGGSKFDVILIKAPSKKIIIDSCKIGWASYTGICAMNGAPNNLYVSDITVSNCIIDKKWTSAENNINGERTSELGGDGVLFSHGVERGLIKNNIITNFGHSGIVLMAFLSATNMHGVHNIIIENNDVSAGKSGYLHAIDITGFPGKTTHNIIRRNYFHDYTSTGHIQGSYNYYYSNIFANIKLTIPQMKKKQPYAADMFIWFNREHNVFMEAHDIWVVNNTFINSGGSSLIIGEVTANGTPDLKNIYILNNLFVNPGLEKSVYFGMMGLEVRKDVTGLIEVRNNNFFNKDAPDGPVIHFKGKNFKDNYTVAAFNGCAACGTACSGNIQVDPHLSAKFAPTAASPAAIRSGGTPITSKQIPGFVDYRGKSWKAQPGIGAIQF